MVNTLTQDALEQCDFVLVEEDSLRDPPYGFHRVGAPVKARKNLLRLYEVGKDERFFEGQ